MTPVYDFGCLHERLKEQHDCAELKLNCAFTQYTVMSFMILIIPI